MTRRAVTAVASVAALAALLLLAGCSGSTTGAGGPTTDAPATTGTSAPAGPPRVAVSTPLVGALVRSVGGSAVMIDLLLPPDADPTTVTIVDPASAVDEADLVVLADDETFERNLAGVVDAAEGASIPVLALAPQLNPIPFGGSELDSGSTDADGATDPHVWLDPDRWTQAARLVGDQLVALGVDPAVVQANVAAFDEAASATDERMQASFALVPEDRRIAGTDLGGLGYLADRHGIELVFATEPDALAAAVTARGITTVFTSPAGVDLPLGAATTATVYLLDLDASAVAGVPDTPSASIEAWTTLLGQTTTTIVDALRT